MKSFGILSLLLLAGLVTPAAAFTAERLEIAVDGNGDGTIELSYSLNWLEYMVVYLRIADPGKELSGVLGSQFGKPVLVTGVTPEKTSLHVQGFAWVKEEPAGYTLVTPALSFREAGGILSRQWFARLVSPDFSPAVTTVKFPDGYRARFNDQDSIPAITRTITR